MRWTRQSRGHRVYSDDEQHVQLILRTLGIDEERWSATLDRYVDLVPSDAGVDARLAALARAFRDAGPTPTTLPDLANVSCVACGANAVTAVVAKPASPTPLVYGRCGSCGHGQRLTGPNVDDVYQNADYYRLRSPDGTGYAAYADERQYREAKGARLLDFLEQRLGSKPQSLLEVGSGFGYTLAAAAQRGWRTLGVDVNPAAARAARAIYGFETLTATLEQALSERRVTEGDWDVVLYGFVLEHLESPSAELRAARRALAPGGCLALVVPNMEACELDVFGSAYRSLRSDHLHLFSARSLRLLLTACGLDVVQLNSHCNLHLFRGFLEPAELEALYRAGRGPDLTILARSRP
ncbi:MAG TPA: class I SAM-dependent methyltransferase [Polyangiaceae bacterium]|nr:class I SAM-dependent methyltransferase [Polyangiaceae bacterium]